jgi:hypothetical protein
VALRLGRWLGPSTPWHCPDDQCKQSRKERKDDTCAIRAECCNSLRNWLIRLEHGWWASERPEQLASGKRKGIDVRPPAQENARTYVEPRLLNESLMDSGGKLPSPIINWIDRQIPLKEPEDHRDQSRFTEACAPGFSRSASDGTDSVEPGHAFCLSCMVCVFCRCHAPTKQPVFWQSWRLATPCERPRLLADYTPMGVARARVGAPDVWR